MRAQQVIVAAAAAVVLATAVAAAQAPTVGLLRKEADAFVGYTLFTPLWDSTTYLLDIDAKVVHSWPSSRDGRRIERNSSLSRRAADPRE